MSLFLCMVLGSVQLHCFTCFPSTIYWRDFVVIQRTLSCVQLFAASRPAAHQASLSITSSELSQTHVHRVSDAIQPFHPLSFPSPPAFNLSQHQGLFQWVTKPGTLVSTVCLCRGCPLLMHRKVLEWTSCTLGNQHPEAEKSWDFDLVGVLVARWDCLTQSVQFSRSVESDFLLTQTHVHCIDDAIQPSHPLSSPSPPALNLSQHQGLFKWVSFSHQVAKVLEFQLQHQSFQWMFRVDFL